MEQASTAGVTAGLRSRRSPVLRAQATRRDPAALAAMYEHHHQALYRYCRSILHNDEEARDALQSTMAKALAALRSEERDFELRPWLFRIARNEAISRLRQRRAVVALDAVGTLGTDSLAQAVEDRERLALLCVDLRDLPERQRSALVLRELSGLSHEEIAGVLDSSARAIKQTIFEARAALHECAEGRTMLCADVQRVLSDGDGRVLRGRRVRAHVRSCRSCRQFKAALVQRPADLAALAPALPATAGAALLSHLLPGAKAGLASGAGTAAGAGGGMAVTVATKAAIVAIATATLAGTGTVVRDAVTAPDRAARPGMAAPSAPRTRTISATGSAPASLRPAAPASLRPAAPAAVTGSGGAGRGPSHAAADRGLSGPSRGAAPTAAPTTIAPPAQAQHERRGATEQATGQSKRQTASSHGRRPEAKAAKSPPTHSAKSPPPAAAAKARPAAPERRAVAAAPAAHAQPARVQNPQPATHAQPAGVQDPQSAAADTPPADTPPADTPAGNSGAAHAAK
jgi:RNA polymerase sigma factor (sigma-70 family)